MADLLVDDGCMRALLPKLKALADHLRTAVEGGKYFAIRYHNDCDGICAGLSVFRALNAISGEVSILSLPSEQAVYGLRNALKELQELNDARDTIMLLVDHGANPESIAALKMLKAAGVELAILDHHPHDRQAEKLASHFISPLIAGGSSSHTAGLLCYELAKLLAHDFASESLAHFSLQADMSAFALKEKLFEEPAAIDYIANYEPLGLEFYDHALENRGLIREAFLQATEKINLALKNSERFTEDSEEGKFHLTLVRVSKFMRKGEYPPRGKVMNEIIARKERELGNGKAIICIGMIDESISFRANAKALALGFDANALIGKLKSAFGQEILNGGGHSAAAALQANADAIPAILKEITQRIASL